MAARLGLEPRQTESESVVLPLHYRAVKRDQATGTRDDDGELQVRPRGRSATPTGSGAGDWIRTRNRLFTKQVLYR